MKNVYLAFVTIWVVSSLTLWGCSKDATSTPSNTMKVADFEHLGKMHNDFMSNALNNLRLNVSDKTQDEVLSIITEFNVEYAHNSYSNILPENITSFNDFKEFLDNTAFNKFILKKPSKGTDSNVEGYFANETGKLEDMPSLSSMIDYLYSCGTLREKSYNMLSEIVNNLSKSVEGQISDANFCGNIDKLVEEFDNYGFKNNEIDGEMIASILAISIASIEWWQDNPDAALAEDKLPAVVSADLGGAVTGIVIDGIRQGICLAVNAQDGWDWASTGWAALGGAVDGSLGISSKIIGAFRKFLG